MALQLFAGATVYSQPVEKIKFKKNSDLIYFFQKDAKSDTLFKNKPNLFYLLVPDSLRSGFVLSVENGRLMPTTNDSLLKFEYLPGLKYETFYAKTTGSQNTGAGNKNSMTFELKTLINGTTDKHKNVIVIRISDKKEDKMQLENIFYYR
ncbi:MAG: hypothetical protein V4635_01300 [Bacteroidota bacterium]